MDDTRPTDPNALESPGQAKAQQSSIDPDDPKYPKYKLRFAGKLVDDDTPSPITGPHTLTLLGAHSNIRISISRNPTDPEGPDLTFTISEV